MKKSIFFTLLMTVCAAYAAAAPEPADLDQTLSEKAAEARPVAWHIDNKAVLNVSLSFATNKTVGQRTELGFDGCRALVLNRKGLVLMGESCAKALNSPVSRVYFSATLPKKYAGKPIYYREGPLALSRFKRGENYALYQLREYVEVHSPSQYQQGITNPRVLAEKTTDIFKDMEIPQIFGVDENQSFILEDFKKIFRGRTPDAELAAWLEKHMSGKDFAALHAPETQTAD